MTSQLLTQTYTKLLSDISSLYEHARRTMVRTYWAMGKRIVETEQESSERAQYGEQLLRRLSRDLTRKYGAGFSATNLKNMRKFYLEYPIRQAPDELDWTHYVELLSLDDREKRARLTERIVKEGLTTREVRDLMRQAEQEGAYTGDAKLTVVRGKLNTYTSIEPAVAGTPAGCVTIDCGFNVWRDIKRTNIGSAVIITPEPWYMYQAVVEKVIDGDTLWAVIDCGFGTKVREKLRLRGIDTPELKTKKGQKAKAFVQRRLKQGSTIVIRSSKSDKYDRYLADVFYIKAETRTRVIAKKGVYLNQELIDKNLARRWP